MEHRVESGGNSRAAQKKRKLQDKRRHVNTSQLNVPTIESSCIQNKKIKSCGDKFSPLFEQSLSYGLSLDVEGISVVNLLELENTIEVSVTDISAAILSKIVSPINLREFYGFHWKKSPALISNADVTSNSPLKKIFSLKSLKSIILKQILTRNVDIDIINNINDNNEEIFNGSAIWKDLTKGKYGIQLLQPQKFNDLLWKLLSTLEFEFDTRVACTAFFFPKLMTEVSYEKNDSNCFLIQQEGSSEWTLDRLDGCVDEVLKCDGKRTYKLFEGNLLYVPQGWKPQITSTASEDCFIIELSIEETQTKDLLHLLLPQAVETASINSSYLKKSLPNKIRSFMGVAASECDEENSRALFSEFIQAAINDVVKNSMEILDPAIDQLTKNFIARRLPVPLSNSEELRSIAIIPETAIHSYTQLRLLRPGIAIAVVEDGKVIVYHCMDNSRELYGNPLNPIEFELDDGPAIEALLLAYPQPITVSDLYHPSEELDDKLSIAQALYKEGFLLISDDTSIPELQTTANSTDDGSIF